MNTKFKLNFKDESKIDAGNYFVSFIDILGFGKLIENTNFQVLKKIHLSVYRFLWGITKAHQTGKPNIFYQFYKSFPKILYIDKILEDNMYNFSDSIILYIKTSNDDEDNLKRFRSLCQITNIFIAKSIIQDPRVFELPLRAGIAYGPAIMDKTNKIHIGHSINDAYELSESLNWMGGAIDYNFTTGLSVPEKFIKPLLGYDNEIIRYKKTPIKERKTSKEYYKDLYVLNWVRQHPSHKEIDAGRYRPTYNDIGKSHVDKHKWGTEIRKCEETMKFVKMICDEFDKKKFK